jgi:leucyl/phenylalanyl-tRNA--protein transferase
MLRSLLLLAELADETGLVAIGGDLHPRRLIQAYSNGVFPWFDEGEPICWWSPDPRAIIELGGLHVSRRLRRTLRSQRFTFSINNDFAGVIRSCADRREGTWITAAMVRAYETLHHEGWAHSVEAWRRHELAGGIYGVAIGGFFAGESMFTRDRDASKACLVFLVEHLHRQGFQLFDIQFRTEHTTRLGAIEIARAEYLVRLKKALTVAATFA